MSIDQTANDFLMKEGSKSFSFDKIGDTCKGEIISAEVRQQTDIDSGERQVWADGTPRMQLVIQVQTDERLNDEDDGIRVLYAKGGKHDIASGEGASMRDAIAKAVREAGGDGLHVGDQIAVAYMGEGVKKNRGFNAPKLYVAGYQLAKREVSGADLFSN